MPESVIQGDHFFTGNLRAGTMTLPGNAVTNGTVQPGAAIDTSKLNHRHRFRYSQPNTTATTETKAIGYVYGATGTLIAFHVGSIVPNLTTATVTVDLRKNGTTMLTGVVTLNNANTARVSVAGTLASTALVAGDLLEVVVTATAAGGTLATGVYAFATVDETAV